MTKMQKEQLDNGLRVAGILVKKKGYIKGYGNQLDRVMDGENNPLENISGDITRVLLHNKMIYLDGLVYRPQSEAETIKTTAGMGHPDEDK
jgi:hypothetical protein